MIIITNNPKLKELKDSKFCETDYMGILTIVRDFVHQNYRLLTHPLYGSVKPNETVYRSIIIEESSTFDTDSLLLIEEAIETCRKFLSNAPVKNWPSNILEDFQIVDSDIIQQSLERIHR